MGAGIDMLRDIFQTAMAANIALLLKMAVGIIIAIRFGPEGRGYVAAFLLVPELLSTIVSFSIKEGLLYNFAKRIMDIVTYRKVLLVFVCLQIPIMILVGILLLEYIDVISNSLELYLFLLLIPLLALQELYRFTLRGVGNVDIYNQSVIIEIAVYTLGSLVVICVFRRR